MGELREISDTELSSRNFRERALSAVGQALAKAGLTGFNTPFSRALEKVSTYKTERQRRLEFWTKDVDNPQGLIQHFISRIRKGSNTRISSIISRNEQLWFFTTSNLPKREATIFEELSVLFNEAGEDSLIFFREALIHYGGKDGTMTEAICNTDDIGFRLDLIGLIALSGFYSFQEDVFRETIQGYEGVVGNLHLILELFVDTVNQIESSIPFEHRDRSSLLLAQKFKEYAE